MRMRRSLRLLFAFALVGACVKDNDVEPTPGIRIDAERFRVDRNDDDYTKGGTTPLVTIVVFTDFACPPCARSWQVFDHLVEDYGDDLQIVFRSYTVPGFGRGEQAAEAAYAAGAQGKFWEMHARLFAQGGDFDRPTLRAHAEELGLDVPRFLDELDTGTHAARRARDRRAATALGITGLPAMFINGLYVAGFVDEATMHGIIDEEIKRARGLIDEGAQRADLYATMMANAATKRVAEPAADQLRKELADKQAAAAPPKKIVEPRGDARYRIEPGASGRRGPADAPVVIVAFVDFECPFCKKAWQEELAPLLERNSGDVALAIRQLPLPIHTAAVGAAKAAIAAGKQGKLWEFHDRLLAHDGALGRSNFVAWVKELGMDEPEFLRVLDDAATRAEVDADVKLSEKVGVNGTPGFFVNGRYVGGYQPGVLDGVVTEELARANEMIAKGTPRGEVFAKTMAEAIPESEFPNP
ncbi:MAG TPA: thioredoxin domain-containing protein [Nannocystaceae bacterium]|nr:thioredoxin domain-containing protein [Nannocystaceae bacterium]